MTISTTEKRCIEKIKNNQDDLEGLAETDLPAADLAEALLEVNDR